MLKAKMEMVNEEIMITLTENCRWNEMATKLVVLDWICEGNSLPINTVIETLDAHLQATEDGEIIEFDRKIEVSEKMETMYLFCLKDYKTHGTATEKEINELCKVKNSELWIRYVAPYDSVLNRSCEGWDILEGNYIVSDGVAVIEEEDIFLIPNLRAV